MKLNIQMATVQPGSEWQISTMVVQYTDRHLVYRLATIQMPVWYYGTGHLNNQRVKVHCSDVSTIQICLLFKSISVFNDVVHAPPTLKLPRGATLSTETRRPGASKNLLLTDKLNTTKVT